MTDGDIHSRKRRIQSTVQRIQNEHKSTQHNRNQITAFKDFLYSQDLSNDRISRYLYTWYQLLDHIDFKLDEPEKEDLIKLIGKINQNQIRDKKLSEHTRAEYKKAVKKFYTHFLPSVKKEFTKEQGKKLCDFFSLTVNSKHVDPDRLPRPNTVRLLVGHCTNSRDKAILMTLWSTAGRIGEVLGLKWKDIRFHTDIAKVKFRDTKTGGDRIVPMHAGFLYLKEHKEKDHKGDRPEAYVFRSRTTDDQLSYNAVMKVIERARKNANLDDRIKTNPHAFRKGRATYLASQGMNQAQLCEFGGWVQGSTVVAKYIRMAESDVEAGLRQIAGLEENDTEPEEDLNPVKCHNCETLNKFEAENCTQCGEVLTTSNQFTEIQVEEAKKKLTYRIMRKKNKITEDKLDEKARELVSEEMGLDQRPTLQ